METPATPLIIEIMTPAQQRRRFDRITRQLERKYIPIIRRIIISQLTSYAGAIQRNPLGAIYSIDTFFPTIQLEETYEAMIRECFNRFRIEEPENVIKAIDTSVWVTLMQTYINTIGGNRITQINRFTKAYVLAKLRPILNEGIQEGLGIQEIARSIVSNIAEYTGKFANYRASRIARTEIIGSSNRASLASVEAAGLQGMVLKRWLPTIDPERTRESHLEMANHPAIPLDQKFEVKRADGGSEFLEYPGDPNGSPGNVINCRCTVIYERV